jgi:hypothetical protein
MKKGIHFNPALLIILISLLFLSHTYAVTINWIGGTGDWFNAANWDTGNIPTLNDDVFINSGNVFINNYEVGEASAVTIGAGASLELESRGTLIIEIDYYTSGLLNNGYVGNKGFMEISSPYLHTQEGITNFGTFTNSGDIQTYDLGHGISNRSGATFTNSGFIEIFDIAGYGANALTNWSDFSNSKYGKIEIHDVGGTGGTLTNTGGGYFGNAGEIEMYNLSNPTTTSLSVVSGLFENLNGGILDISLVDGHGIDVSANGTFRNRSTININGTGLNGIQCAGFFVNHQAGYIINLFTNVDALVIYSGGEFRNFGALISNFSSGRTLSNLGIFNNYPKGYFLHDDQILSTSTANLVNQGLWESYHTGNHIISGPFTNNTAIGDQNDGFAGEFTNNQGIRIHPMTGLVEVGEPYANLFDMGTLNFVTIQGFTDAPSSSTSVGTYNTSTNTFTPNSNALGLTEIYVTVKVNTGGNNRKYKIEIPGGVQPAPAPRMTINSLEELEKEEKVQLVNQMESQFKVYPNPNFGDFNLELPMEIYQVSNLQVLNSLGEVVYQINPGLEKIPNHIQLPNQLPSGTYLLKIRQENGQEMIKKIQVVR